MDEDSNEDLFDRKELRKKKDKKRQHKTTREKEECTKESFKKMKEEIDELRKKETERARELEELKKKIEEKEMTPKTKEVEYTLGFDKIAYLRKGFIESAQWIKNTLAKTMIEKMNEEKNQERFATFMTAKKSSAYLGYRACARYNRGEECSLGKWHLTHKPDGIWTTRGLARRQDSESAQSGSTLHRDGLDKNDHQMKRNELRLHVCTLCLEALGSAVGHRVLDCPWILKKNWSE